MHELDPNFPDEVLDKVRAFLSNDDVFAQPQNHFMLIHEMKIEAALITNNSPYAEVRAVVSNTDDPTIPCPSIAIEASVAKFLAWPMGKAAAKYLPGRAFTVLGKHVSLNPGPFNKKEHMLIAIMASNALDVPYTTFIVFSQYLPQYFNQGYAGQFGYQVLVALGTNFVGYGIAGFLRRFLVYPTYCVWPTSLVAIALNESFHSGLALPVLPRLTNTSRTYLTHYSSFRLPNYLIQALSFFNWPTWIAPHSVHLNAMTGMRNGLGFNPLPTLDWNIPSFHYTSPLVVPFFNSMNGFLGMFVSSFGVLALWYANAFHTAHLPINSQRVFDRFGRHCNVSRAIEARGMFDAEEFAAYSPTYLGASYVVNYMMHFALYAATISYAFLYDRHEIWQGLRGLRARKTEGFYKDVRNRLMAAYPEVRGQTSPAVIFHGVILCLVFVIPIGIIQAVTGMQVWLFVLAEFIGGLFVSGNALAVNYFKGFGCITCAHALHFSHSLKLAHYVKLPPRTVFAAQLVACVASTFACTAVMNFQMRGIPNVCREDQKSGFTCPNINTFFTATIIWGTIGPRKLFGKDGQYRTLLFAFPIGFVLPFGKYSARKWLRYVNVVVLLHSASRWALYNLSYYWPHVPIAWLSMVYLKTRFMGFWSKYNYVTSAALSAGVVISAIVIFFALQYPGVALPDSWWGNHVSCEGCENPRSPCVLKPLGPGGTFGPQLGEF
ncbi:OPT oligopeptide transporter protein-domain-containing protein [Phyllosticta citricarpa]